MTDNIHAVATPHKSRDSNSSYIFAWLRQIDTDPKTSAMEFRLAYVISQMLNKRTKVCFPLQATLAKRLGVSDRAVREYIAGLADRDHLRVRHRGRDSSSVYEPVLQDRNGASGHDAGRPEDTFRSSGEQDRKSDVARPEESRRKTGTVLPTEPPSEPSSITKERRAPQAPRRKAPSVFKDSCSEDVEAIEGEIVRGGVAVAPPPNHLQRGLARAQVVRAGELQ
jgi:helix-turn-helix protein